MDKKLIVNNTPWESHFVKGREIWVKREDLCCPYPGPSFSKIRGIEKYLNDAVNNNLHIPSRIGVVDSIHSKAGWGVSFICREMNIPCTVFYPVLKSEGDKIRAFQKQCAKQGAELISLPATKSAVLWYQARKIFNTKYPEGVLLPNGLKLSTTIQQTSEELRQYTPEPLLNGTWIVSVSSGTIAAGVCDGLRQRGFKGKLIAHMGFSRSLPEMVNYLNAAAGGQFEIEIIDEGYQYKDRVAFPVPFSCNPYYDRKAWKWMVEHIEELEGPLRFWNIGM